MSRPRRIHEKDICDILADYKSGRATQVELAERYGVTQGYISKIVAGKGQGKDGLGFRLLRARKEEAARA